MVCNCPYSFKNETKYSNNLISLPKVYTIISVYSTCLDMSYELCESPVNHLDIFNSCVKWSTWLTKQPFEQPLEVVANGGGYIGGRSILLTYL